MFRVAVLTASLVSGLTKAWIGTQSNGAKELSFSDHTHTASQITDLSSSNIVYYQYIYYTYKHNNFKIPTSFTPKMMLIYFGESSSIYNAHIWFASRSTISSTASTANMPSVHLYTGGSISIGDVISIIFSDNYVMILDIPYEGTFDCLVFG